jgi:hypothetical protein
MAPQPTKRRAAENGSPRDSSEAAQGPIMIAKNTVATGSKESGATPILVDLVLVDGFRSAAPILRPRLRL